MRTASTHARARQGLTHKTQRLDVERFSAATYDELLAACPPEEIRLSEEALGSAEQTAAARRRLRRGNVVQALRVRDRSSGRALLVANTHFYWNPRETDVKLAQALQLLRHLERLAADHPDAGLVLCGDLNSQPDGSVHRLLTRGVLDDEAHMNDVLGREPHENIGTVADWPQPRVSFALPLRHTLHLRSAYAAVTGDEPAFTTCPGRFVGTLDYIFADGVRARPVAVLRLPERTDDLGPAAAIPNAAYPSDHLLLATDIELCAADASDPAAPASS